MTLEVFDVYLEPVVDELLQLWSGVTAYNVTKDAENQAFNLRAMLLWTIHNFSGYKTVEGFSHQGYAACPWCGMNPVLSIQWNCASKLIVGHVAGYLMSIRSSHRKREITSMVQGKQGQNQG